MVKLSVNVNKIATIRNARGENIPDLIQIAKDCEIFGADGITVHPRPDERHIKYSDTIELSRNLTKEFNIEGFPDERYLKIIKETQPTQATLVPDSPEVLTSNQGWDTIKNHSFLKEVVKKLKDLKVRVSIFVDPIEKMVEGAKEVGADRIELFTGIYAKNYVINKEKSIEPYIKCVELGKKLNLGINAGHDLSLENLQFFKRKILHLDEVSIGHALISDALYFGLKTTIEKYKSLLI